MLGATKLKRNVLVLALLGGSLVAALAAKLDKTACNELSAELSAMLSAGVKGDRERGPAWAQANLPPDKLNSIKRLFEVEEQLEFRCGVGRGRAIAKSPGKPPAKSADEKDVNEKKLPADTVKPGQVTNSTRTAAMPVIPPAMNAVGKDTARNDPATTAEQAQPVINATKTAAMPVIPPARSTENRDSNSKSPAAAETKPGPVINVARTTAMPVIPPASSAANMDSERSDPGTTGERLEQAYNATKAAAIEALPPQLFPRVPPEKLSPGLKIAAVSTLQPQTVTPRKKPVRRETTYVSPTDVNPYFVTGYGTTR